MSHAALIASYANPMVVVDSADFDGVNDSMARGAGLSGAADSKTGIFSVWTRLDAGTALQRLLGASTTVAGAADRFRISRIATPNLKFQVVGNNAAGTVILTVSNNTPYSASSTWLHVLMSWDLATSTAHCYVGDVQDLEAAPTLTNDTLDYTLADWGIGANPNAGSRFDGCFAEFYFAPGQYLDFSLVANRRKFISASGKPVHLGTTGALPTGTAPLIYQHLYNGESVANFATNRGTGGNFTITGTLDTASTSPSD